VDSSEQLTPNRQGEQDFSQEIEQALEQMDTDMEQKELEKYIDLMPYHQEVNPPTSPDMEAKEVPSDQGDTEILGDNPEGEMHNVSFIESPHRVMQSHIVSTSDNTSPA